VDLFEYKGEGEYEFDIDAVIDQLHSYVYSVNTSNRYRTMEKPIEGVFGMATYGLLKDYFTFLMDHPRSWDRRHLYTLWEHKKCMLSRLEYLEEIGRLRIKEGITKEYKVVEGKAKCAHLLMLKLRALYEIRRKRDRGGIEKIILMIDEIADAEKRILGKVLRALQYK